MIKIQIKSIFGDLLFEYEKENNTIKDTLKEAIKSDADLRYANLRNADLRNADLRNADLRYADLSNANLRNADLRNADLRNADLRNADLSNANLRNADLRNADLSNANLRNAIKVPMYCKWSFGITGDKINIGCENKTIKEWDKFFKSNEVIETERGSEEFKQIEAVYKGLKAYLNHLTK